MDSKERDTREKKGFSERGEKLYNPKKNETNGSFKYDPSDKKRSENPNDVNDELTKDKKNKKISW